MSQLNQSRYDQLLRRVGDLKGPGSKVNDVLTELFPMIDVEQIPAELLLLQGSRLCMGRIVFAAGGVGNFVQTMLANPTRSGVIARVTSISVVATTQQDVVIGPTQNTLAVGGQTAFVDTRVFGQGTVCELQGTNNNLVTGSDFFRYLRSQPPWEPPAAIGVIHPGGRLQVSAGTANEDFTVSYMWVERVAQPSELNV